jgi:hypothetical protein
LRLTRGRNRNVEVRGCEKERAVRTCKQLHEMGMHVFHHVRFQGIRQRTYGSVSVFRPWIHSHAVCCQSLQLGLTHQAQPRLHEMMVLRRQQSS